MKHNTEITKTLFIRELERPALAALPDVVTTFAVGEECWKGGKDDKVVPLT